MDSRLFRGSGGWPRGLGNSCSEVDRHRHHSAVPFLSAEAGSICHDGISLAWEAVAVAKAGGKEFRKTTSNRGTKLEDPHLSLPLLEVLAGAGASPSAVLHRYQADVDGDIMTQ